MLKIELDHGSGHIEADGDLKWVVADLASAIHRIYNMLERREPEAARIFKLAVQSVILDTAAGVFKVADIGGDGLVAVFPFKDEN